MPSMDGTDALPASDSTERPDAPGTPAPGSPPSPRAQRKHHQIAAEAREAGEAGEKREAPGFGALNRQLTWLTEQLGTVHRRIGRIAAERDALRQQLADLQGIPVEEVPIPLVGAPKEE